MRSERLFRTVRRGLVAALLVVTPAWAADATYSIKTVASAVPKEIQGPIAKVLGGQAVQLRDARGEVVAEVWLRKEVPTTATLTQLKNGLSYRDLDETVLLGAIRFVQPGSDYRKQPIKPGVYTLRLAFQPVTGDHTGTAPYAEFCLLVPAALDATPEPLKDAKELQELSTKATGTSHPGVFLLFPNDKPSDTPRLQDKGSGHLVLNAREEVTAGSHKAALGIGLTLVGHSSAE